MGSASSTPGAADQVGDRIGLKSHHRYLGWSKRFQIIWQGLGLTWGFKEMLNHNLHTGTDGRTQKSQGTI